ncbi:Ubiquinone/menaquinone biosynthesis C-methylase UbiE [Sphingomonas sp. EC-HK361]|uniref:class I SAM-dependent methyltransferase n=1 Tax=Sphingomonas sp. EC-HK361 TaxID=2038397 RepID=UPI0012542961|nr:class I SAM-dependent methyltransferase [Sphingomonas sp. EC-HK361]VVT18818.1 Ubiquinone/menaquinone biosynthesis C-methylase UbiE [Sphingomonas sp. EC-HK361]
MTATSLSDTERWDDLASFYEQAAHPYTALFARLALDRANIGPSDRVLDVATGTGALALAAAETGAQVLATDFSDAMIRRVLAHGIPNLTARVMDGQALELPDDSFDAAFSIFGVFLFPDWRAGLSELSRVVRPHGKGAIATWQTRGAGPNILLMDLCDELFPDVALPSMPDGVVYLSDPTNLESAMIAAGFASVTIETLTIDFGIERTLFDDPGILFGTSPLWGALDADQRVTLLHRLHEQVAAMPGNDKVMVPSTGIVAVGTR